MDSISLNRFYFFTFKLKFMYMPYAGDTKYMMRLNEEYGFTVVKLVIAFFKKLKLNRLPEFKIKSGLRKLNWNGS